MLGCRFCCCCLRESLLLLFLPSSLYPRTSMLFSCCFSLDPGLKIREEEIRFSHSLAAQEEREGENYDGARRRGCWGMRGERCRKGKMRSRQIGKWDKSLTHFSLSLLLFSCAHISRPDTRSPAIPTGTLHQRIASGALIVIIAGRTGKGERTRRERMILITLTMTASQQHLSSCLLS